MPPRKPTTPPAEPASETAPPASSPAPAPASVAIMVVIPNRKPRLGDIVLYRVGGPDDAPRLRPATVVQVWGDTCVNLQVVFDGANDHRRNAQNPDEKHYLASEQEAASGLGWRTSVTLGERLGAWRFAE